MNIIILILILFPVKAMAIPMPDERLDDRWNQQKAQMHPILRRDMICFFKLHRGEDLPIRQIVTLLTEMTSQYLAVIFSEGFMDTPELRAEGESPQDFKIRDTKNEVMTVFFNMVPGVPRVQRIRLITAFDLHMRTAIKSLKSL